MTMYSETQSQFSRRHYPAQQEDVYAEDTERLYESFNDLYEDFDDGRSKTPFVIIGALLAIAIVGGGLAFAYNSGFRGASIDGVPVVVADTEPVKVAPKDPGGMDIPNQGSLIFDRINGNDVEDTASLPLDAGGQAGGQGAPSSPPLTIGELAAQVTEGGAPSRPIALADTPTSVGETLLSPAPPGNGGNVQAMAPSQAALPKPLLPPGADAPAAAPDTGTPGAPVLSPRKVETFTITPDGRIVSQLVDAAPQPANTGNAALAVPTLPSVLEPQTPQTPSSAPTIELAANQGAGGTGTTAAPSLPGGGTSALVPSPRPKPRPTTRDLAAVAPASAPATSGEPGLAGKFAVQVASNQRQADSLAIFADLKRRYPDLVGNYRPLIQRADLGSRGIFYRLRIGPLDSKADANRLCGSLRNAGLPGCIVRSL